MRQKSRWKCLWFLVFILQILSSAALEGDIIHTRNAHKSLFSPRMDYNQWKPLGRGDPLKNDPTFDYVPPVLDHVHYWMDPEPRPHASSSSDNGQKTEILLLGVSSKKPATNAGHNHPQNIPPVTANDRRDTVYEPYSKYYTENSPNHFNHHSNQRIARPNYFPSMTSQIIPSIMSLANKVFDRTSFLKEKESRVPYTVLMPPPMVTQEPSNINQYSEPFFTTPITQKPAPYEPFTSSQPLPAKNQHFTSAMPPRDANGVTVQESNLIYQSSSLGNQKEFESVPSISWELPAVTEPNRNNFVFNQNLSPPKSFIRIQFAPQNYTNKILEASDSSHNINYVTPPPLNANQMMYKGIVDDDNDLTNSYVKIEKPEAQMDHMGVEINNIHPMPVIFPHAEAFKAPNNLHPMSVQTLRDMETMKPPPVTYSPVYTRPTTPSTFTSNPIYPTLPPKDPKIATPTKLFPTTESPASFKTTNPVASILKKEKVKSDFQSPNLIGSSSSIFNTFVTPKPDNYSPMSTLPSVLPDINTVLPDDNEVTTLAPPSATTILTTTESVTTLQTLTTDPLFKHYRQPVEPMRGPLYLIIQGHSKVKTYKPAKQIDGVMVQETNEIPYIRDRNIDYSIKHLHGFNSKQDFLAKSESIARQRQARTGNLQTLKHVVLTGLGAIDFGRGESEMLRRSDVDLQETDLEVGYEVVDSKEMTSEKYHKGIVEEARKLKT